MTSEHPLPLTRELLLALSTTYGQEVTLDLPPQLVEAPSGEPLGVRAPSTTTVLNAGIVISSAEAAALGVKAGDLPGVFIAAEKIPDLNNEGEEE